MADVGPPAVVIDNGTGFTKMGYAGGVQPQYTIPTCIGLPHKAKQKQSDGITDLDFFIGDEAQARSQDYAINFPINKGVVENWDNMEKIWQRSFFKYLKCEPENHHVMLTEPPLNAPENRELMAEIMFETFNVPGLYIAVSAVLALTAAWESTTNKILAKEGDAALKEYVAKYGSRKRTGAVIDSGDGVTNVVPIYEGYVVGSSIRKIPVAGNDVTEFIKQMLRDRRGTFPVTPLRPRSVFRVRQRVALPSRLCAISFRHAAQAFVGSGLLLFFCFSILRGWIGVARRVCAVVVDRACAAGGLDRRRHADQRGPLLHLQGHREGVPVVRQGRRPVQGARRRSPPHQGALAVRHRLRALPRPGGVCVRACRAA